MKLSPYCLLFCQLLNEYSHRVAILPNFLDMSIVILTSGLQTHLEREQGNLEKRLKSIKVLNTVYKPLTAKAAPS